MLHMSSMTHVYGVGVVCHPRDCTSKQEIIVIISVYIAILLFVETC